MWMTRRSIPDTLTNFEITSIESLVVLTKQVTRALEQYRDAYRAIHAYQPYYR